MHVVKYDSMIFLNKTLMRSITLRRTKNSKIEGKPILSLPEKYQTIRKVQLSQTELQVYQSVEARAQAIFDSGSVVRESRKRGRYLYAWS